MGRSAGGPRLDEKSYLTVYGKNVPSFNALSAGGWVQREERVGEGGETGGYGGRRPHIARAALFCLGVAFIAPRHPPSKKRRGVQQRDAGAQMERRWRAGGGAHP
jgi:hypothetical protein